MSQNKVLEYLKNCPATIEELSKSIKSSRIESYLRLLKKKNLVNSQEVLNQKQGKCGTYYYLNRDAVSPPNYHHPCKNTLVCKKACKNCAYYKGCWEKTSSEYL
ncbi:MAG: hypothetical protein QXO19_03255 [Candidatus Aenigmatarchaeota archaeon]